MICSSRSSAVSVKALRDVVTAAEQLFLSTMRTYVMFVMKKAKICEREQV